MYSNRYSIRRSRLGVVAFAVVVLMTGVVKAGASDAARPSSHSAKLFVMAAQDSGGLGESGPVLRYDVTGPSSSPTLERTINDPSFFRPCCFAFTPSGEMFVVNRGDPFVLSSGYISRILNPSRTPVANGTIALRAFSVPHWAAFREGELFVGNAFSPGGVSRWRFGSSGTATFNGSFTTPSNVVIDVAFGPH